MTDFYNTEPIKVVSKYNKRRIWLIAFAFFVVFVGVLLISGYYIWYNNTYNATISLSYAPVSAAATMDGKPINAGDTKVEPGSYTIVVKKSGFTDNTSTVVAKKDQSTPVIIALTPNSPSTASWYSNNPQDQKINEAIGAKNAASSAVELQDTFPVANVLPLTGPSYQADYGTSPTKKGQFAIFVTYYTTTGQQDARDALVSLGYNPSDYEIIYINGM
ncbi:MAG: hypothetical protein JWN26_147 [Candidatus Saccharibacteria bacterium]|nr:hypothetical protein [Candidatus Saccharibacteria bacterium]